MCCDAEHLSVLSVLPSLYSSTVAAALLPVLFAEETKWGSKRKGLCGLGEAIGLLGAPSWAAIGSMLRIVLTS